LDPELLEEVDALVRAGVYASRSEAIRALVEAGLEKIRRARLIAEAVEKLFELERREGKPPIELRRGLRQLLEERERISAL
jgi:Arc/MetJ-type ribon-helix-helix transcriptional regulator